MARKAFDTNKVIPGINLVTMGPIEMSTRKILGSRIRQRRIMLDITQQELADKIGIAKSSVCTWENGRTSPDIVHINKLCAILNTTPSILFGVKDNTTPEEDLLLRKYRVMSKLERKSVTALMDTLIAAKERRHHPRPHLVECLYASSSVAAGIGDDGNMLGEGDTTYLHESTLAYKTDIVFHVNGESMNVDYPDGCFVSVSTTTEGTEIKYGDVGIFQVDGALYIKEFCEDGLHSQNPAFPPMFFKDYPEMYLIGIVNGVIPDDLFASPEEIDLYKDLELD